MLADTLRLGDDAAPSDPFASWVVPCVLPDPQRVKRVIAELERGLAPTRPEFLKWISDKLSALPSQTASGVIAALWSDNVIDVCAGYPEDLLQSACLELLKTRTFRPSPAEIVKVIEPKHSERRRMLARARKLLPEAKPAAQATVEREPEEVRLRLTVRRFVELPARSFLAPILRRGAVAAESRLAEIEGREVAEWARSSPAPRPIAVAQEASAAFTPDTSPTGRRLAALAEARRTGKPLPEWRDEPMGDEVAA